MNEWLYAHELYVWCAAVAIVIVVIFLATYAENLSSKKFNKDIYVCRWEIVGDHAICDCLYCTQQHGGPAKFDKDVDWNRCPYCGKSIIKEEI